MWLKAVWFLILAVTFDVVTNTLDENNAKEDYDEIPLVYSYNIDKSDGRQWTWPKYALYRVYHTDSKFLRELQKHYKMKNLVIDWDSNEHTNVYRVKVSPEERANFVKLLHCRKIDYKYVRKDHT